jgi:LysR family transcriptional regulator, cell division regulator
LVLRAGCSYRQRLEDILARRGVVGTRLLEFGTIEAILGCAAAGLGITLMPRGLAEASAQRGRIAAHALPANEAMVETLFIRRRDTQPSRAQLAFLGMVRPLSAAAE